MSARVPTESLQNNPLGSTSYVDFPILSERNKQQ